MPRDSPYVVYLTDMERRNLEAVARKYMSPYVDAIRYLSYSYWMRFFGWTGNG